MPRFASSGRQRQTIAAVFCSPVISTISPGFKFKSLSKGTLARPCPTSLGIAFATLSCKSSTSSFDIPHPSEQSSVVKGGS